jgi:O-antigen ligase
MNEIERKLRRSSVLVICLWVGSAAIFLPLVIPNGISESIAHNHGGHFILTEMLLCLAICAYGIKANGGDGRIPKRLTRSIPRWIKAATVIVAAGAAVINVSFWVSGAGGISHELEDGRHATMVHGEVISYITEQQYLRRNLLCVLAFMSFPFAFGTASVALLLGQVKLAASEKNDRSNG